VVTFGLPLFKPVASTPSVQALYTEVIKHDIFTDETASLPHFLQAADRTPCPGGQRTLA
jgi:hypothetical protein